jgi:universal stress protein A
MDAYKKILAAIDFSDHSDDVIKRASQLARQNQSSLVVLHVVSYALPTDVDYLQPRIDEVEQQLADDARNRLETLLEDCDAADAQGVVVVGPPKQEIMRVAEQENADLIVVGAHGNHGIAGLLGSTTDRVLHRATCDVLTVH